VKRKILAALAMGLSFVSASTAHEFVTRHGGRGAEAGGYHVELVVKGGVIDLYLTDEDDKAVPSAGHKGVAIFVVGGKNVRVTLEPAGTNRLTGKATEEVSDRPKGAVRLTGPNGKTSQAKFD
jgi:hypothetical protein